MTYIKRVGNNKGDKIMIMETIATTNGEFQIFAHSATSVKIMSVNPITVNKIPYNATAHYTVADMILTETYRFISRTDTYVKEATYAQKDKVVDILKRELFDFIFSNPEILVDAQKNYVNNKLDAMRRERDELTRKVVEKQEEISEFWEANREVFSA